MLLALSEIPIGIFKNSHMIAVFSQDEKIIDLTSPRITPIVCCVPAT